MAKKIFNRRVMALVLALIMCFSMFRVTAQAAPARNDWSFAYYLGQEYLGNAGGAPVKPDPVGYGFQGVITELTFTDDAGKSWTFVWSSEANGEWRITGKNVSEAKAKDWPQVTSGKTYVGYCGGAAYTFTLSADGSAKDWTYARNGHANWFYYIRFIRAYTVNVFYQNETGSVIYNGEKFAADAPLTDYFYFMYPDGGIIDDSEFEDGEYTEPTTLLPEQYLPQAMKELGYEIKYATDAQGNDVLTSGVTISLLGENVLNVYCTLIPPATENYSVIHNYYTEGTFDGSHNGGQIEVEESADFAQVVASIEKQTAYNGNAYSYVSYSVDAANKVITLTYSRQLPTYNYSLIYNANFGGNETKADSENAGGIQSVTYGIGVDHNSFVRENYTFVGWNTAADGTGTAYTPGDTVMLTAAVNSATLYAQWQENPKYGYSLIYNANFGASPATQGDEENTSVSYAENYNIGVNANPFSRPNYTFIGWNTDPEGIGAAYAIGDTVALTAQKNSLVLYAQWQENPKYNYSVIYHANYSYATAPLNDSQSVVGTYATAYSIDVDSNPFTRSNYTFIGWAISPDGDVVYQSGDVISFTEGGCQNLYAQWIEDDKHSYSVIYNGNGGQLSGGELSYGDSENITDTYATRHNVTVDENPFVYHNYAFTGWNTAADGSGTAYSPEELIKLTSSDNTVTLYAQWEENDKYDYALIYNANFGESPATRTDSESVQQTYAASYTFRVDANSFVRENYTFLGWATAPEGQVVYQAGNAISFTEGGSATLYAQWQENPKYDYTVIYNANFGESPATRTDSESVKQTYAASYTIDVDANSFARENYTFLGWATAPEGQVVYQAGDVISFTEGGSAILFAKWQENPKYDYTVVYNANFGDPAATRIDGESVKQVYVQQLDVIVDGNGFVRENYSFLGWNTAADGSGTAYIPGDEIHLTSEENTATLYAQWSEHPKYDYKVRYNANFGVPAETKLDAQSISGIYATTHTIDVDANSFVRANYTFIGWNTKADGSGTPYAPGNEIRLTSEDNSRTLYAQWEENPKYAYSVIYNANFGSFETKADSQNIAETYALKHNITVDANSFLRENYTFIGWNTAADGTGTAYTADQVLKLTAENNSATLYAQWEENAKYDYSVIYNANFGFEPETKEDSQNVTQVYDTEYAIEVDANAFERANHTFLGWSTTPNGQVEIHSGDSITFAEGGSMTLYALWAEHDKYSYSLIYNGNGGALAAGELSYGDSENIDETYATAASVEVDANSFVRENYTFTGWNTAADGSGTAYSAKEALELTAENNTATLYAQWEENDKYDYTVTYDPNYEGSGDPITDTENEEQTYEPTHEIEVDENPFEREGYSFEGWSETPDGEVVYQAGDIIEMTEGGDVTLYAQWTVNEYDYTVIYMVRVDGGEYQAFAGQLPADAPTGGKAPYGTLIDEAYLQTLPAALNDGTYTYDYNAIDTVTVPYGTNTVIVYYTYITPAPAPQNPPAQQDQPQQNNDNQPQGGDPALIDIEDEDVPLADVPKTGDPMLFYIGMTALSGLGLLKLRKKEEEETE